VNRYRTPEDRTQSYVLWGAAAAFLLIVAVLVMVFL
jgi:hypothetical protein